MGASSGVLFTFRLVPAIAAMLGRAGVDVSALLAAAGLPPDAFRGEVTAPLRRVQDFVDRAGAALGTDHLGLDLATSLPGGAYGLAEFLVRSAATTRAGLETLCEFAPLINPSGQFRFEATRDGGELHYSLAAERDTLGTALNELTIAYVVRQFRAILGGRMPLREAWFSHTRRRGAEPVAEHFGCPVRFGARTCGFALGPDVLALVPATADALLHQFLREQAHAQLSRLQPFDIMTQVIRVHEVRLATGDVSADAIAKALASTSRSLQRHLADAGTTYRAVLAHVRERRRAELVSRGVSEGEIARELGFSSARAMRRSFGEA